MTGACFSRTRYTVIENPDILNLWPATDADPWEPKPASSAAAVAAEPPAELTDREVREKLVNHHFHSRNADKQMRKAGTSWKAWADNKGGDCPEAVALS